MLIDYILIAVFYSSLLVAFVMVVYKVHTSRSEFLEEEYHDMCIAVRDVLNGVVKYFKRTAVATGKKWGELAKYILRRSIGVVYRKIAPYVRSFVDDINGKHSTTKSNNIRHGASFFLKEVKEHKETIKNEQEGIPYNK